MTRALIEAPGRGVRVVVLLPGAIDNNIVRQASRSKFGELLKAGVEINDDERTGGAVHRRHGAAPHIESDQRLADREQERRHCGADPHVLLRDLHVRQELVDHGEHEGDGDERQKRVGRLHHRDR